MSRSRLILPPILGPPGRFNMAAYAIGRAARVWPDKPALMVIAGAARPDLAEIWTYARLEEAVTRIAGALAASGLAPGGRVLIRMENTSLYALLFFGAVAGGFVPIPSSSQLTAGEALFLLEDSGARAIALSERLSLDVPEGVRVFRPAEIARMIETPARASYADTGWDDPAFLVYTSGTSGSPKGVLHAHRSAFGRRPMYRGWYGLGSSDRVLHAGAFNWTYTLGAGLTDPWANGATAIVYTGEKDPALWPRLVRAAEATLFAAVPGVFRQILKYAAPEALRMPALRHGLAAGEAPPPGLFDAWREETGTSIHEALGMSEISTFVSSAPAIPRRAGAVGKPQPGRRVVILPENGGEESVPPGSEGLLAVHRSDPGLMLGYWNRPGEDAEAFRGPWFIGGDLARMDADSYVTHLGRANDVMNAQGYRVAPQEVEAALARHPDIAEVACAEVGARRDVTVIGAFIVPRPGARLDPEAIKSFAAEHLAAYKCPREIVFLDALPRTANGKVKRRDLSRAREMAAAAAGKAISGAGA